MAKLWILFLTFLKIGAFTFGGGYAMIPLITGAVTQYQWLGVQEITDIVAISQMTPGPLAINAATFTGIKVSGLLGGVVATVAVSLPCICITGIAVLSFWWIHCKDRSPIVMIGMSAVLGIVGMLVGLE